MPDYGFALTVADLSFRPRAGILEEIETSLKTLEVIGERLPSEHPDCPTITWTPGPRSSDYLRGNPTEMSVYAGEPTPFFDGTEVVCHTPFILETTGADPSGLKAVLEGILGTPLAVHPFRL